jgi:predicted amidohydrolase
MKPTHLTIAVAQMKFRAAISDNVSWLAGVIHSSARKGADAILFPECAVTGYNCDFTRISRSEIGAALRIIASEARAARCYVLMGCPTFKGRQRFNFYRWPAANTPVTLCNGRYFCAGTGRKCWLRANVSSAEVNDL